MVTDDFAKHPAVRFLAEAARQCSEVTGCRVLSLPDIEAWLRQGRPKNPTPHRWSDAEDGIVTCVWCGAKDSFEEPDLFWCPEPKTN